MSAEEELTGMEDWAKCSGCGHSAWGSLKAETLTLEHDVFASTPTRNSYPLKGQEAWILRQHSWMNVVFNTE